MIGNRRNTQLLRTGTERKPRETACYHRQKCSLLLDIEWRDVDPGELRRTTEDIAHGVQCVLTSSWLGSSGLLQLARIVAWLQYFINIALIFYQDQDVSKFIGKALA